MTLYRFGRTLQVLALLDIGFALFFGGAIPALGGMDSQLQIVLLAVVLFGAGRLIQTKGEARLRAAGIIPGSGEEPGGTDTGGESGRP
jgi:hypothetical protein